MITDPAGYAIESGDGVAVAAMLNEVTDLYDRVHAADQANPLYHRDAFLRRTRSQVERPGFAIVWARDGGGNLIGLSFGLPLGAGKWWSGTSAEPPPAEILDVPKFAVIELIVAEAWRGRGMGRRLLDELLAARSEPYATLTTRAENPARQMYARWGWRQVGTAQHTPEAPVMDQLVLPLR